MADLLDRLEGDRVSVVVPTLRRPTEVAELLENLSRQTHLPYEVIFVDGAPAGERETEEVVKAAEALPFPCRYIRHGGGTAIQRNIGIEAANGHFIALIDDDICLEPDFLHAMLSAFRQDTEKRVGGIVGYRVNEYFEQSERQRWRWYRRLRLLTTFEPGRYDFQCGYPINANGQPPFTGVREVDFMTTSCAVWRREVFCEGLWLDPFFKDYGVLEDAHFSLRAGRRWKLWQCGDARCRHFHSPRGRVNARRLGYKCVVNYYYVFNDIAGPLRIGQRFRFWRYQLFELLRVGSSAVRRRDGSDMRELFGRLQGFASVCCGTWKRH